MTDDELIERVIAATGPVLNRSGFDVYPETVMEAADAAIRVALTEVLGLVGTKQPRWGVTTDYDQGFLDGWDDHQTAIAREIRSLLPKDSSND